MKRKRYTEEQIAFCLRQHESGTPVGEIVRKMGISEQTFYRWKTKCLGRGPSNCLMHSMMYTQGCMKKEREG